MNSQSKNGRRVIAINAILFAALFGLILLNKKVLRPAFNHSELLKILSGCFPNFIAAYLISGAAVAAVWVRRLKRGRFIVYLSAMLVSAVLILEEIKPMWGASEHFDRYDIFASLAGSILAIITFEILLFTRKRHEAN